MREYNQRLLCPEKGNFFQETFNFLIRKKLIFGQDFLVSVSFGRSSVMFEINFFSSLNGYTLENVTLYRFVLHMNTV